MIARIVLVLLVIVPMGACCVGLCIGDGVDLDKIAIGALGVALLFAVAALMDLAEI